MTRQLQITDSQRDASDRANLRGAIYLLSGTLVGRASVPDIAFYWSTREVSAFGQDFKPYIAAPQDITRSIGFEPGAEPSFPEVRIPVRNLPFAHSESLVAAVTDNDYRFENTTATLRVAYLRPGVEPDDLADADFTPLVLNGFLGPPDEITLDGFILPVYNRGARRNQSLLWPQLPSPELMLTGAIDDKDAGTMPAIVVGCPRDWIRPSSLNLGVRGFTSSGYSAGDAVITFRTITVGSEDLVSGNIPASFSAPSDFFPFSGGYGDNSGRAGLMVQYLFPIYDVVSAGFDPETREFTVQLQSGLAADIPRGAFVQQWGPGFNPSTGLAIGDPSITIGAGNDCYAWVFGTGATGGLLGLRYGWLFPDGEVRPFYSPVQLLSGVFDIYDYRAQPWRIIQTSVDLADHGGRNLGGTSGTTGFTSDGGTLAGGFLLERGTRNNPSAPCYFDPLVGQNVEVQTQPEFTQVQTAFDVVNLATSSTHTGTGSDDSDNAHDGSWATNALVDDDNSLALFFGSAPAPYANGDTTGTKLRLVVRASTGAGVDVTNGVATTYFTIPGGLGAAEPTEFTIQLGSPADFNQELHFTSVAGVGGAARIVEAWWEHNLAATVSATRTTDVTLTSATTPLGPELQYAELVVQPGFNGSEQQALMYSGLTIVSQPISGFRIPETVTGINPFTGSGTLVAEYVVPYPTAVMVGMHMLLGPVEGDVSTINMPNYRDAHQRYVEENIRLGFVWTNERRPSSWSEIERTMGEQSRAFMFYGPSGHEILFLEEENALSSFPVLQSFRLPGVPGANVFGAGQPLYSRTRTTELVNQFDLRWDVDSLTGEARRAMRAINEESFSEIGMRTRDRGEAIFDCHMPWEGNALWTVAETLSGMAQFYADRSAFVQTRFAFDTAWIAHGLDRGSRIRVSYPVSLKPPSFRNVTAEVESVTVSPLDSERFSIVARSIGKPQKGIDPDYTWADVFDLSGAWSSEILQEFDVWADYWSIP